MRDPRNGGSYGRMLVDLLRSPWPWIILGVPVLAILAIFQPEIPDVEVSRPQKVFLTALLVAGFVGAMPASRVLAWLYDPPRRYLVRPGLTVGEAGLWELSPAAFQDLEVVDGELFEWPGTQFPTYEVLDYDPETHRALGTWRGSASDGELIDRKEEIREVRQELEAKARERDVLVTRAERIVREEILANTRQLIEEYNRATIVDVERLQSRLDESMSDGLEGDLQRFRRSQTDPDESTPDPDHDPEQPVAPTTNGEGEPHE